MSVGERDRHHLHTKAAEAMGGRAAEAPMSYLPPVGWADVATKRDLEAVEQRLEVRFQRIDDRFGEIDRRFAELP